MNIGVCGDVFLHPMIPFGTLIGVDVAEYTSSIYLTIASIS